MCQMDQLHKSYNKRLTRPSTQDCSKQGAGLSCVVQVCSDSNEPIHDSSESDILLLVVPLC